MTEVWKFLVNSVEIIKNLYNYRLYRIKRWFGLPPRIKRHTIKKFHVKNILGFGTSRWLDKMTHFGTRFPPFAYYLGFFILDGALLKEVHLRNRKLLQFFGNLEFKLKGTISTFRCIYLFVRDIPTTVIINTSTVCLTKSTFTQWLTLTGAKGW